MNGGCFIGPPHVLVLNSRIEEIKLAGKTSIKQVPELLAELLFQRSPTPRTLHFPHQYARAVFEDHHRVESLDVSRVLLSDTDRKCDRHLPTTLPWSMFADPGSTMIVRAAEVIPPTGI